MDISASAVAIRPAQPVDLPALLGLLREFDAPGETPLDLPALQEIFARFAGYPQLTLYVAEQDGNLVGTFLLLIMDTLAHAGAKAGVVEDVVVHPACRSQGIGRQMMQFAIDECRRAGCYKLALSSNLRRTEAHRFYEGLGFERHGVSFAIRLEGEDLNQ